VNTMATLANGTRNTATLTPLSGGRIGDDIILSNVLSFEIKPTWTTSNPALYPAPRLFPPSGSPSALAFGTADIPVNNAFSTDHPYDTLHGFTNSQFDTLNLPSARIRMQGVQVRLRVYDIKVKTARQSTFLFDL
jgi:hypothetical protein